MLEEQHTEKIEALINDHSLKGRVEGMSHHQSTMLQQIKDSNLMQLQNGITNLGTRTD